MRSHREQHKDAMHDVMQFGEVQAKKKMVVKRVSVDRYTHEFNEEDGPAARNRYKNSPGDGKQMMGEVRKFV